MDNLNKLKSIILRRRRQLLVHSCIYYHFNDEVISDALWQQWANQLAKLQKAYPHPVGFLDEEFKDWTGETGFHLPYTDSRTVGMAHTLLRNRDTNYGQL